jgi:hypothetical protein
MNQVTKNLKCLECYHTSFNPNDVENKYCPRCYKTLEPGSYIIRDSKAPPIPRTHFDEISDEARNVWGFDVDLIKLFKTIEDRLTKSNRLEPKQPEKEEAKPWGK